MNHTDKVWGYEELLHNKEFCTKVMGLDRGAECSVHCHATKKEMFIVVKGAIRVELWPSLWGEHGCLFQVGIDVYNADAYSLDLLHPEKILVLEAAYSPSGASVYIDNYVPHRFIGLDNANTFIEASTHDDSTDSFRFTRSRRPDNR
jgi:uncharacterized RmlC-like cupin family protein